MYYRFLSTYTPLFLVDSWTFGPLAHELMGSDGPDQFVVVGAMQAKLHFQF